MERREPSGAEEQSFDETLRQLQAIVERLERGELPLEESLRAFERGVELSRQGQTILDAAERRVEILLRDGRTEPLALGTAERDGGKTG
jgi:exodeoxyribonuclease VII small subunit